MNVTFVYSLSSNILFISYVLLLCIRPLYGISYDVVGIFWLLAHCEKGFILESEKEPKFKMVVV